MRLYLLQTSVFILLFCNLLSCNSTSEGPSPGREDLYADLDAEIDRSEEYDAEKNARIISYKHEYDLSGDKNRRTILINKIIGEYEAYNADSALYYIGYNLKRPALRSIPGEYTRLMIKRADVYAHAGLFADALSTMQSIPSDSLTSSLLEDYYTAYCAIYQYLSEFTNEYETSELYERKRSAYSDSLSRIVKPGSFHHLVFVTAENSRKGDYEGALKELSANIDKYQPGTREYSILASVLGYIYKEAGSDENYKRYLVLSAISDVKGSVKENMSFREVATVLFEDGDIERANRYLKKSIGDANFFSSLMRNAQSSRLLPVIDGAYSAKQTELTQRLRTMVWVSSILSVILLITIVFILKQIRSVHKAKDEACAANEELSHMSEQLKEANNELTGKNEELSEVSAKLKSSNIILEEKNGELSRISEQLKSANSELARQNIELAEYNRTKEQYAGLFMEYCSSAISALQHYQKTLRNLAAQRGNLSTLQKKLETMDVSDQVLKNFYQKFDEAILNIYPSFVEKFNALLNPGEKIVLKSGELLNTELRLFALIRIGIDDNAKIADFLRCSISTVYTYRSKMKKRAANPESFEQKVKNIG